jgi:release factor glutamine methyltransferase
VEHALELTRKAAAVLAERGITNARLEAELLLAGLLGMKRLDLYLQHDRPVDERELARFRALIRRRLKHEPLQYILGTAAFRQLELHVDARVLIPRPETEVLVGAVLQWHARRAVKGIALDIGTGSGAIALSLAREGDFEHVVATDISADALDVARANAAAAGLTERVTFREGSLFEAVSGDAVFAAIVSNPPYVAESERASLAAEVRDYEPAVALFAGARGLDVIERIVRAAPQHLEPGGLLALEIGISQRADVLDCVERAGYENARVEMDLTGRPRVLLAERPLE